MTNPIELFWQNFKEEHQKNKNLFLKCICWNLLKQFCFHKIPITKWVGEGISLLWLNFTCHPRFSTRLATSHSIVPIPMGSPLEQYVKLSSNAPKKPSTVWFLALNSKTEKSLQNRRGFHAIWDFFCKNNLDQAVQKKPRLRSRFPSQRRIQMSRP